MQAATLGVASISTAEIADGAVTTEKIASGAVVEADIASNAVTAAKLGTDVQLGYRNVIINGAMQVAQRGTSVTGITTEGYRTADRFTQYIVSLGTWTETVENDAPTGSGLRKSLKLLCTTADASPAASDVCVVRQKFEGQNLQQFLKGTASAKQWSLSFWVKSNKTGTYTVNLYDLNNNREVSAAYTISASATWEKKVITFPADTTGALNNDNAAAVELGFNLGAGSNFTSGTLNTVWSAANAANRAVGQTNVAAATNNYWQITGVQLEAGSVATPFEFEDYGTTLRKCQRYYYRLEAGGGAADVASGVANSDTSIFAVVHFPTTMRSGPSAIETTGTASDYFHRRANTGSQAANAVPVYHTASVSSCWMQCTTTSFHTTGQGGFIGINSGKHLSWSAEL